MKSVIGIASLLAGAVATSLDIGGPLAAGNYGVVHTANFRGRPAVAKTAAASSGETEELAKAYLSVEREANEAITRSSTAACFFPSYLGQASADGKSWLVWDRLPFDPGSGLTPTLHDFAGDASGLREQHGLELSDVLRSLLQCTAALHSLGYVHRDMKLENVLIDTTDATATPLRLIDLGSAAMADGCTVLDAVLRQCTPVDADKSPCSPLYAPPEAFLDVEHPWAFDTYSIGICVLRLALRALRSDEALASFRLELAQCDGELDAWVRTRLAATAVEPTLVADLAAAFPSEAPSDGFALLCAMLRASPAKRPSVDALLAHPYVDRAGGDRVFVLASMEPPWLPALLDGYLYYGAGRYEPQP